MKISHYFSAFQRGVLIGSLACSILTIVPLTAQARAHHASGGGTYFVAPGMRSEFQFNKAHVQCKVAHGVMPDGTVMQMFMFSTSVDSVTIDSVAKTVRLTGSMVSTVNLKSPDGTAVSMTESVPFEAFAKDNSTPGGGVDFFSITVLYNPQAPKPNQFGLFGSPATFAGTLVTGNVTVN